jgi:hypothetical protein
MDLNELQTRAKETKRFSIEECTKVDPDILNRISLKRNKHGIKIMSSHIPEKRDGINEWFKKFTVWNTI